MRIELHCHSTVSDGSLSPSEVADLAAAAEVELFCLTDHDSCAGYAATSERLAATQCQVLRGLEFSCKAHGRTVHLLVYRLQVGPSLRVLETRLEEIASLRRARIGEIRKRLSELGIHLGDEAFARGLHDRVPGRPDVARALVHAGVCRNVREAFDRFLRDGGPADVPVDRVSLSEALALGKAAGGRMSLAHPHTFGAPDQVRDLVLEHRSEGLDAIEALYGRYGRRERRAWLELADGLGVCATGGSDAHGDLTPEVTRLGIDLSPARAAAIVSWLEPTGA